MTLKSRRQPLQRRVTDGEFEPLTLVLICDIITYYLTCSVMKYDGCLTCNSCRHIQRPCFVVGWS